MDYFFIVNPNAGQGRTGRIWERLVQELEQRHVDYGYVFTSAPGEATELTRDVVEAGYGTIVGVGGDGTLHEIAGGLGPDTALGVIPGGTGNDFSLSLGIPADPVAALDALLNAEPQRIDRPSINGRPFLNMSGVGFDATVAKRVREKPPRGSGSLPYVMMALRVLATYKNPNLVIELDGKRMAEKAFLVAVGNGAFCAGGMHICPRADLQDGQFDVCIAKDLTKFEAIVNLIRIFKGQHIHHPKIAYVQARHVRIFPEQGEQVSLYADGEPLGEIPVEMNLEPGALTVLAPPLGSKASGT